jgi:hypothetical protein
MIAAIAAFARRAGIGNKRFAPLTYQINQSFLLYDKINISPRFYISLSVDCRADNFRRVSDEIAARCRSDCGQQR